nr:MAG TPA: hypothetical protein [Caudoviricetes sp.]
MKRYYLNSFNNLRMENFLLRNNDIQKDNQGSGRDEKILFKQF